MEGNLTMQKILPEVTYTPESALRHPRQLLNSMIHDLLTSRELAWRLFVRNLSAQYRQSILGYVWACLPPLVTALTFVFLNSQQIMNFSEGGNIPYPAYAMVGTLLWQGFVDALNSPLKIITQSQSMLAKINFPREALILAGFAEVLFNFVIRLILLVIVYIWFGLTVPSTIWLAPFGVISLLALGLMLGLLLSPLGVLYQDIQRSITIFVSMWLFLTPVAYMSPKKWPASLITNLNPVSPLLVTTREMLITGSLTQLNGFWIVSGITFALLLFGWLLYRLAMPRLIERMSA
jgi:lipopolysaccharide transport system permease protein